MYQISISQEEIEGLELRAFPGKIIVVDDEGPVFKEAIRYLKRQKVVGFDTETRPTFEARRMQYGTALLQLSGPTRAYLFRLKKLGMPQPLCDFLADPAVIKVGAATDGDIHGLQRLHGFKAQSVIDLQHIAWEYGIRDMAVKKLTAIILGFKISKAQQLSNWEADTLSEPQRLYAATDAWVCREMYVRLARSEKHPLTNEERIPPQSIENQRRQTESAEEGRQREKRPERKARKTQEPRSEKEEARRETRTQRRRRQRARSRQRKADAAALAAIPPEAIPEADKPRQKLTPSQRRRRRRKRSRARKAAEAQNNLQNEQNNG